jgi:hypothetical protein
MKQFIANQPSAESPTDLIFGYVDDTGERDSLVEEILKSEGHTVEYGGWKESVAPDGVSFVGDVIHVQPPLGLPTLLTISLTLKATMGIANGYFENNPRGL